MKPNRLNLEVGDITGLNDEGLNMGFDEMQKETRRIQRESAGERDFLLVVYTSSLSDRIEATRDLMVGFPKAVPWGFTAKVERIEYLANGGLEVELNMVGGKFVVDGNDNVLIPTPKLLAKSVIRGVRRMLG